jgi:hypothetical protein
VPATEHHGGCILHTTWPRRISAWTNLTPAELPSRPNLSAPVQPTRASSPDAQPLLLPGTPPLSLPRCAAPGLLRSAALPRGSTPGWTEPAKRAAAARSISPLPIPSLNRMSRGRTYLVTAGRRGGELAGVVCLVLLSTGSGLVRAPSARTHL